MVPRGDEWKEAYDEVPADVRHLAIHDRHLTGLNDRDRAFITPDIIKATGAAFWAPELRERVDQLEAAGTTEVAYQPAGPDIPRELEAFAKAFQG
jgi:5,10-methylenetetrahydromethanopterin reductase